MEFFLFKKGVVLGELIVFVFLNVGECMCCGDIVCCSDFVVDVFEFLGVNVNVVVIDDEIGIFVGMFCWVDGCVGIDIIVG